MRKQILPVSEIERNRRVAELMKNKIPRAESKPMKLSVQQFDEVKELMTKGYSRADAVKIVLETEQVLNKLK